MKNVYLITGLFTLLSLNCVNGQHRCHGSVDPTMNALVQQWTNQSLAKNYGGQTPVIRLVLNNVRKTNGTGGNNWADIRAVVEGITPFFAPYDICFTVVAEKNIDNSWYYNMTYFGGNDRWEDMIANERTPRAINIFFVKDADSGGRATGALFGDVTTTVTLSNTTGQINTFNSEVLAHELGHCLGLLHTHHRANGIEEVPRTGIMANCQVAGDGLCDTPADPNLNFDSEVNNETECLYIGNSNLNGFAYNPDTRNVMSYTLPNCMLHFTQGQGNRMRGVIQNTTDLDEFVIPNNLVVGGYIPRGSSDMFYSVENTLTTSVNNDAQIGISMQGIATIPYFGDVIYEAGNAVIFEPGFFVSTSPFNNIVHDRVLEVRIGTTNCLNPFIRNDGKIEGDDVTTTFSALSKNKDISIKNTEEEVSKEPLSVSPNPFTQDFTLKFELKESGKTNLIIYDALGRVVETVVMNGDLAKGKHQYQIDATKLNSGIYYVKLNSSSKSETVKIVVL